MDRDRSPYEDLSFFLGKSMIAVINVAFIKRRNRE